VWHIFSSVAHFSNCGAFCYKWRIFSRLPNFTNRAAFFQVWRIFLSVAMGLVFNEMGGGKIFQRSVSSF